MCACLCTRTCLAYALTPTHPQALRVVQQACWREYHYMAAIVGAQAPLLGHVRERFNALVRALVNVLKDTSASSASKAAAAGALAVWYDACDLAFLARLGLASLLRAFVDSAGSALRLGNPHTKLRAGLKSALGSPCEGSLIVSHLEAPLGALWCGVVDMDDSAGRAGAGVGPGAGAAAVQLRLCWRGGKVRGAGVVGGAACTVLGAFVDAKTLMLDVTDSGNVATSYRLRLMGRKMAGTWHACSGGRSGQVVLHCTRRPPVPPHFFSRVNTQHIQFRGAAVAFTGTTQIGVVQAALPLSAERSYFEVQVLDQGRECAIAVGVAHRHYPLDQMPGWRNGSIAYHMDDGKLFFQRGQGHRFGEKCSEGDVVGCGIELSEDRQSVVSIYWTRNGHLAGRELGASALQLPLFASVALHSQRECVFVFEAPPPPSLAACFAGNLVNTAGATVKLGTDRGFTHLFYCGQRSAPRAAGAETVCGPAGGAQCAACEALQEACAVCPSPPNAWGSPALDTGAGLLPANGPCLNKGALSPSSSSCLAGNPSSASPANPGGARAWEKGAENCAGDLVEALHLVDASAAVWALLRVLVLQLSAHTVSGCNAAGEVGGLAEDSGKRGSSWWVQQAEKSVWGSMLAAFRRLVRQSQHEAAAAAHQQSRAMASDARCIEAVTASSSSAQVGAPHAHASDGAGTRRPSYVPQVQPVSLRLCVCVCVCVCVCKCVYTHTCM